MTPKQTQIKPKNALPVPFSRYFINSDHTSLSFIDLIIVCGVDKGDQLESDECQVDLSGEGGIYQGKKLPSGLTEY